MNKRKIMKTYRESKLLKKKLIHFFFKRNSSEKSVIDEINEFSLFNLIRFKLKKERKFQEKQFLSWNLANVKH